METSADVKRTEATTRSESTTEPTLTRTNMLNFSDKIRIVDTERVDMDRTSSTSELSGLVDLDLFCYTRCDAQESDFVKQCRGVVFCGDDLVMKSFPYTDELPDSDREKICELLQDFSRWSFYEAYEGALLRMFYFAGVWYLSTHRKLNAFRSKWSSRESFGTLFCKALCSALREPCPDIFTEQSCEPVLEKFRATLDKNKQYVFLLRNNKDNRIVCQPPEDGEPLLFHVGTFQQGKFLTGPENLTVLPSPARLSFSTPDELLTYCQGLSPQKRQGIVCMKDDGGQFKILNSSYQELFRARGNEPSVKFRYLQVRMDQKMTDLLKKLYPDAVSTFDEYENTIFDIARGIHRSYIQRFIKKNYVTVPREEYQVIQECHSYHLADRRNNRVTIEKVVSCLNKQPPVNLNHMIRRYKMEQIKKMVEQPRDYRSPALVGLSGTLPEPLVLRKTPVLHARHIQ